MQFQGQVSLLRSTATWIK